MKIHRLLLALPLVFAAACGDDGSGGSHDAPGIVDGGADAPLDASCFTNPTTHKEIINACTTAQKIYKDSHPSLLMPDGTVPPLP